MPILQIIVSAVIAVMCRELIIADNQQHFSISKTRIYIFQMMKLIWSMFPFLKQRIEEIIQTKERIRLER